MEIQEILGTIGLKEKEAKVYATLLELGSTTAYAVAKKAELKRPTVYVILEELRTKGFVLKSSQADKTIYTARMPDEVLVDVENKLYQVKSVLPQLLAVTAKDKKPQILYFEGIAGARELLWYGLDQMGEKEMIGFHPQEKNYSKGLGALFKEYEKELDKSKIPAKEMDYEGENFLSIGDTFVRILDIKTTQGVVIENASIAKTMRQIFEMLWACRKEKTAGISGK